MHLCREVAERKTRAERHLESPLSLQEHPLGPCERELPDRLSGESFRQWRMDSQLQEEDEKIQAGHRSDTVATKEDSLAVAVQSHKH